MPEPWGARSSLVQLTLARLREYTREPEALFWSFVFPALMALALGIAFRSQGPAVARVGVETATGSEAFVAALEGVEGIEVRSVPPGDAERALRDGDVDIVIQPVAPPVYRFDPSRPESRLARLIADDVLQRAAGRTDRWMAREDPVRLPGSRYIDWLVPGLLGLNVMATSLWAIGFMVVQMRTRKLLKRIVATPMRKSDFLMAQVLGRLIFLGPETVVLVVFAWLVFGVVIKGSILLFALVAVLGALSFSAMGLLVATRAKTVEAVSGLLNVVMVPMWILSGIFFSTSHFPRAMQPFISALPLTAVNDALRAVMLEGAGWTAVAAPAGVLVVWGLVSFGLALRLFRWG
jgi:ABC-type multidrug transport system permease subunit